MLMMMITKMTLKIVIHLITVDMAEYDGHDGEYDVLILMKLKLVEIKKTYKIFFSRYKNYTN